MRKEVWSKGRRRQKAEACHVKCDEGAYFTVGRREE
jgi:hypothetical protein